MKSLVTIQKTFKVFKTLSKVAMILAFVACGVALIGLLCGVVWYSGGKVYGADMDSIMRLTETAGLYQMIGALLSDAVFALTDGLLFLFAWKYFRAEEEEGTPFTHAGADQIRSLGIKTIVMPLVAAVISAVIYGCFDMIGSGDWSNAFSVVLGIVLILASLVFHYGADLEMRGKAHENCDDTWTES